MTGLLILLQITDSAFPIGGFTHSYGLETYVQKGIVHDVKSAEDYAKQMLEYSLFYNDAAFVYRTWNLCSKRSKWTEYQNLDETITALKAPFEIRDASKKLSIRFLKMAEEIKKKPKSSKFLKEIQEGRLYGHYAMVFAVYAFENGISLNDTMSAFYFNSLSGIVTNCAKLVPISQMASQKILRKLQPVIEKLVEKASQVTEQEFGLCCIAQEIRCMQHEKLYTRLYIS